MMRVFMRIVLIAGVLAMVSRGIRAESPYAANGLGLETSEYVGRSRGMGDVGLANADGINLLRGNPALLSGVKRYTFAFGATYSHGDLGTPNGSETNAKTDSDFLSLAVPVFRGIVVGWGMAPVTRTNAKLLLKSTLNGIRVDDTLDTNGGINVSTAGIAGSFRGVVRAGYSLNYYFGSIQEDWTRSFPDNGDMVSSAYHLKRKYSGYSHTIGAIITPAAWLSVAASYTTEATLDNDNMAVIGSLINEDILLKKDTVNLPAIIRGGVYTRFSPRFEGGIDVTAANWEDAAETAVEQAMYTDTFQVGAGLRYAPDTRPGTPYLKTLPLSLGMRMNTLYYKSYPVIDTISEKAVSLGIEFPLRNELGSVMTTFEAGRRGDEGTNGWDEFFTGFSIALIGKIL